MTSAHVVHFGDLHLRWSEARRTEQREARDLVRQAIDDALAIGRISAWIWPGDLNDGPMTIADRNFLAETLCRMAEYAPVFIAYGNHDRPHDLDVFRLLRALHLVVVADKPGVYTLNGVSVALLPYPSKSALVAAGGTREDTAASGAHALEAIVDGLARQLEDAPGSIKIVAGHLNVAGSLASTGQPQIGRELEISPALLERFAAGVPIALNHIHAAQTVGRATYAGSMSRLSWGETEPKRFVVYRYGSDREAEVISVPIKTPPMYHVEAVVGHGVAQVDPEVRRDINPGADVRVRFDYPANDRELLKTITHQLKTIEFPDARTLKIEPHAVPAGDIRAPGVAAAETLEDKVAAWLHETSEDAETRGRVSAKLLKLQQLDEAGVLASVRQALDGDTGDERGTA